MLKKLVLVSLFSLASGASAAAWYQGQWTCNLDGRLTEMKWQEVELGYSSTKDGITSSSEHGNWQWRGQFKDVGRGWVKLTRTNDSVLRPIFAGYSQLSSGNTLYFVYGGDNTVWKLVYNSRTDQAVGNSTWRGKPYPFSCIRSAG